MKFKLWILGFAILIIYGIYAITHTGLGIRMETAEGYDEIVSETEGRKGFFRELGSDFSHMVTIVKDFFTVFGGGESQFSNGFNVLIGEEDIERDASGQELQDISDTDETKQPVVVQTVAEKLQSQKEQAIIREDARDTVLVEACVMDVEDGNTFNTIISDKEAKIRLIGVEIPKPADSSSSMDWEKLIGNYTRHLLKEEMTIYLEYDKEPADKYGHTLAYAWLSEDTSNPENIVNAILVKDGYAFDKVTMPNDKYESLFRQLRIEAQSAGIGLWAEESFISLWED